MRPVAASNEERTKNRRKRREIPRFACLRRQARNDGQGKRAEDEVWMFRGKKSEVTEIVYS